MLSGLSLFVSKFISTEETGEIGKALKASSSDVELLSIGD